MSTIDTADVIAHFEARASYYDKSSRWCTDEEIGVATFAAVDAGPEHEVLDVACGTGLVSRLFKGKVKKIVGVDITRGMYEQAQPYLDDFKQGPGEDLPFADASFDRVVSRQGTQFMDDKAAAREMFRVLRPGGKAVVINLCAYGEEDKADYFEILRLRNPARVNFYLRQDMHELLAQAGFEPVEVRDFVIEEDVGAWADNKAISGERRAELAAVYGKASEAFLKLHAVRTDGDLILDKMLFGIAIGVKPA